MKFIFEINFSGGFFIGLTFGSILLLDLLLMGITNKNGIYFKRIEQEGEND